MVQANKKNMKATLTKKTLTPHQVSEMYGIAKGTLGNYRAQRRGPRFYKVGKKVLYRIEDIEAYLFQNPVLTFDSVKRCDE